jgi:hypothetical protein
MADDSGAQRQDYGNKKGETGDSKVRSSKPLEMIKAGGSGDGGGPTGSSRSYPKGSGGVKMNSDFNPMSDKKRGGTDWAVGGV